MGIEDQPATNDEQTLESNAIQPNGADTQPKIGDDGSMAEEAGSIEPSQMTNDNPMNTGSGGFPGVAGWNGSNAFNGMNPMMANPMFNFPNGMGTYTHRLDPGAICYSPLDH